MTTAQTVAKRSLTEKLTAVDVEGYGGAWDSEGVFFKFPDGSRGAFNPRHAAVKVAVEGTHLTQFSHYKFEVE